MLMEHAWDKTHDQTQHQRTLSSQRAVVDFLNEGVELIVELQEANINASSTEALQTRVSGDCKVIGVALCNLGCPFMDQDFAGWP